MTISPAELNSIELHTLKGDPVALGSYSDDVKLIVNVASRCGLAPQYEQLEELQRTYADRGFTVLGFPSNQFLQELGSTDAIQEYCSTTWGVTFPMFEKIQVNGRNRHPLYKLLTAVPYENGKAGRIKWNFEKFVVTPEGNVSRFLPTVTPNDPKIVAAIEDALAIRAV
ncbi:MAG: glutathione peroxidase [Demequinaceae bacterium]|nr:glutathione peroxidase [Demequinaceae bacterium]